MRIYEGHSSKERSLNIFLLENEWDAETQTVQRTAFTQVVKKGGGVNSFQVI